MSTLQQSTYQFGLFKNPSRGWDEPCFFVLINWAVSNSHFL